MNKENDLAPKTSEEDDAVEQEVDATPATPAELVELRKKAKECDDLVNRLKRVTADYQNSQKRLQRQTDERVAYAIEEFARELLVVSDDLSRAITATKEHQTVEAIQDGLQIVENHLYAVLDRHGVTPITTKVGESFNPEQHEAMAIVESDEMEPNRIAEEYQKGFLIHERLLRAARVIVTTEKKSAPEASAEEE